MLSASYMSLSPFSVYLKKHGVRLQVIEVHACIVYFYLLVVLAGGEEGFEHGSKTNDVEKAARHQTLQNNHHGVLEKAIESKSGFETKNCHHSAVTVAVKRVHIITPYHFTNHLLFTTSWAVCEIIPLISTFIQMSSTKSA